MARPFDHKEVVDTLIDEELDLQHLVEVLRKKGQDAGDAVMRVITQLLGAGHGHITKQALRQVWNEVFLGAFISNLKKAEKQTDENLKAQVTAIRKFGKPITQIEAVVDEDVKQRISEKAGL